MAEVIPKICMEEAASQTELTERVAECIRLGILWPGSSLSLSPSHSETNQSQGPSVPRSRNILQNPTPVSSSSTALLVPARPSPSLIRKGIESMSYHDAAAPSWRSVGKKLLIVPEPYTIPLRNPSSARNSQAILRLNQATSNQARKCRRTPLPRVLPSKQGLNPGPSGSSSPLRSLRDSVYHSCSATYRDEIDNLHQTCSHLEQENYHLRADCLKMRFERDLLLQSIRNLSGKMYAVDASYAYAGFGRQGAREGRSREHLKGKASNLYSRQSLSHTTNISSCSSPAATSPSVASSYDEKTDLFPSPSSPVLSECSWSASSHRAPSMSPPPSSTYSSHQRASTASTYSIPSTPSSILSFALISSASSEAANSSTTGTPPPSTTASPVLSDSTSDMSDTDSEYDLLDSRSIHSSLADDMEGPDPVMPPSPPPPPPLSSLSSASRWSWDSLALASPTCSESSFIRM